MSFETPPPSYAVLASPAGGSPWSALAVRLASVEALDEGLLAIAEALVSRAAIDVAHWFVGSAQGLRSRLWCSRDASETTEVLRRLRSEYAVRTTPSLALLEHGPESDDPTMRLAATLGVPYRLLLPIDGVTPEIVFELWAKERDPLESVALEAPAIVAIVQALARRSERSVALAAEATRFRRLMAEAPVAILLLSPEGTVIEANQSASNLFEVSPGAALALPLLPEDDRAPASRPVLRGELGIESEGIERRVELLAWSVDDGLRRMQVAIGRDITEQVAASRELRRAIDEQARYAQELSRRYSEIALLSQWAETLETCVHRHEVHDVMSRFGPMLFGGSCGSFFQPFGKGSSVEQVSTWGGCESTLRAFSLEDCWAFRRGVVHEGDTEGGGPRCPHVSPHARGTTLCIPLLAQGQPLGLLHLAFAQGAPTFDRGLRHELAKTVGEHVALALANLRLREELRQQSIRDPLTSLHNRRSMEETLEREVHRARRHDGTVTVILLDVDHFKRFNDEHGHDAGDAVLVSVADFLQKRTRGEDLACRYGGEEFLLVLAGAPFEAAMKRAEAIREGIASMPVSVAGRNLGGVTVSIGVATLALHAHEPAELITAADAALYEAKRGGRNRVVAARPLQGP
jgi:diguanylate cyclase (GGDEF)-like protein